MNKIILRIMGIIDIVIFGTLLVVFLFLREVLGLSIMIYTNEFGFQGVWTFMICFFILFQIPNYFLSLLVSWIIELN